jgi:hypothetical protein
MGLTSDVGRILEELFVPRIIGGFNFAPRKKEALIRNPHILCG